MVQLQNALADLAGIFGNAGELRQERDGIYDETTLHRTSTSRYPQKKLILCSPISEINLLFEPIRVFTSLILTKTGFFTVVISYPAIEFIVLDDLQQRDALAGTDVHDLGGCLALHELLICFRHKAHIRKIPNHIKIAELDFFLAFLEMGYDLRDQELVPLPYPRVVKGPRDQDVQPVKVVSCHEFHGKLAVRIVAYRDRADGLIDHLNYGLPYTLALLASTILSGVTPVSSKASRMFRDPKKLMSYICFTLLCGTKDMPARWMT